MVRSGSGRPEERHLRTGCGDPHCDGYFAQLVRITLCRVVDNHSIQIDHSLEDGEAVTPVMIAKIIERHWVPVKTPKKKRSS